jgi:methionine biosynthesis protein MetW
VSGQGGGASQGAARHVDWGLTRGRDRALDDAIVELVRSGERVLDLGCGTGDLLLRLRMEKGIDERGIERDGDAVAEAIARGLAVVEGELGEWVGDLPAGSYDLVLLNQVLPLMEDPVAVIEGALRVGRRVAVSYPNFAHWRIRLTLGLRGRLPVNPALPYEWYNTPNIRLVTVRDFRRLCAARRWRVVREAFAAQRGADRSVPVRALPNLRASLALAVLEK